MEIDAFIQMGMERRETVIDLPENHWARFKKRCSKAVSDCIDYDLVRPWVEDQYDYGWKIAGDEPMEIKAFVQMGTERRETIIEITKEHWENFKEACAERGDDLEEEIYQSYIWDWLRFQYGYGWKGAGYERDYSFIQQMANPGHLVVTKESSLPNTVRMRECPNCGDRSRQSPHPQVDTQTIQN